MKIVITGGTGFLGRHLVKYFCQKAHTLIFTGRNEKLALELIQECAPICATLPQFMYVNHATEQAAKTLKVICQNADVVIHNAALAAPFGSYDEFYRANVISTQEIIDACQINQVPKLIYLSTPSIYTSYKDKIKIKETDDLPVPINAYADTKRQAEILIAKHISNNLLKQAIIFRPRAIFGEGDQQLLPRLLKIIQKKKVPILNKGHALIDLCYVENVVHAIDLAVAHHHLPPLEIFNLSNGEPIPIGELLKYLSQECKLPIRFSHLPYQLVFFVATLMEWQANILTHQEPLLTRYALANISFSQTLDLTRITTILGYQPKINIEEGLRRTIKAYLEDQKIPQL